MGSYVCIRTGIRCAAIRALTRLSHRSHQSKARLVTQAILPVSPDCCSCQIVCPCNCYSMRSDSHDCISIELLEVFARVGVTESERGFPQRLTLTISVWPDKSFDNLEDDIAQTANYSAICAAARDFARERSVRLIETMADQLASHLLQI